MNQAKLKVLKQEMAIVNIDILGISELECVNLTQNNHNYYCGQEPLRRNGVAITVNKRV